MADEPMRLPPLGLWTKALDFVPAAATSELAAELEDLGYGAVWLPEVAGRDVMVQLAFLLSATQRLVGATGIANIWGRDAVTMTGGVKALTEAYPERVLLGLGASHQHLVEGLRGHRYEKPLTAMRDYLDAMDRAPYTGVRPESPIRRVLAGLGPRMLKLAAARTDGAHTYFVTPDHTMAAREAVPSGLLCVEQAVALETDPAKAREVGRAHTSVYVGLPNYQANLLRLGFSEEDFGNGGSDRLVDAIVAWGDEEAIVRRVSDQFEAGADHVCVEALPPGRREVPLAAWRTLAPGLGELVASRPGF